MRIHTLMKSTLEVGTSALEIADNLGGVPFAGTAAALLGELGRSCEQVKIHKLECHHLVRYAQTVLDGLQSSGLEGSTLQEAADELEMILVQISQRMNKWSSYNTIQAFWRRDEIGKAIMNARHALDAHLNKFHIRAQYATHERLHEADDNRRRDRDETRDVLEEILTNQQHLRRLLEMRSEGESAVEEVMGAAQAEYHDQPRDSPRYLECEKNVFNLYRVTGVMPTLPDLSHEVVLKEGPVAGGTYSDVFLGIWLGTVQVALKSLRGVKVAQGKKRFEHEISVWHTLEHPNVLRFLGIVSNLGPHIHVVSPWQANGNALEYVKKHSEVDRLKLLAGAARGVQYLHGRDKHVIHGNLKCANILVSEEGEAVISDFGLSHVIEGITETAASATLTSSGSSRWCAPELMNGTGSPTLATDVYSFGMAVLELCTTERPFAHLRRETTVVINVVDGGKPLRPAAATWDRWFTEELWELLKRCWSYDASLRPQMADVSVELRDQGQEVARRWLTTSVFL